MHLLKLYIDGLRCLRNANIAPAPGLNVLLGANGAGKTSVLEALHLLSRGRSFRSGGHKALTARDGDCYRVFAELNDGCGHTHRLGLQRQAQRWHLRLDGENQAALSDILQHCAAVFFEPGSHILISGGSAERRRFLDWGVFHVEQDFLPAWRRYQQALRQRNALLRQSARDADFLPWEMVMASAGEVVHLCRYAYLRRFAAALGNEAGTLVPMLGVPGVQYVAGWQEGQSLQEQLAALRTHDRLRGHTTVGPHRSDWRLCFPQANSHEQLSRGQEKLAALCAVLAQAVIYTETRASWPIICLDDLASELDQAHQARLLQRLHASTAQVWITGTEQPAALENMPARMFHVEQGSIHAVQDACGPIRTRL